MKITAKAFVTTRVVDGFYNLDICTYRLSLMAEAVAGRAGIAGGEMPLMAWIGSEYDELLQQALYDRRLVTVTVELASEEQMDPIKESVEQFEQDLKHATLKLLQATVGLPLMATIRLPDGKILEVKVSEERPMPFPVFNLGPEDETTYQTYHRGFRDGWEKAVKG